MNKVLAITSSGITEFVSELKLKKLKVSKYDIEKSFDSIKPNTWVNSETTFKKLRSQKRVNVEEGVYNENFISPPTIIGHGKVTINGDITINQPTILKNLTINGSIKGKSELSLYNVQVNQGISGNIDLVMLNHSKIYEECNINTIKQVEYSLIENMSIVDVVYPTFVTNTIFVGNLSSDVLTLIPIDAMTDYLSGLLSNGNNIIWKKVWLSDGDPEGDFVIPDPPPGAGG